MERGEIILELAEEMTVPGAAGTPPPSAPYFKPALITEVNSLWDNYRIAVGAPAGDRAHRTALTSQLSEEFRAAEVLFSELDDLIVQFKPRKLTDNPDATLFVESWFTARSVVDLGHRFEEEPPVEIPPVAGAPAAPVTQPAVQNAMTD